MSFKTWFLCNFSLFLWLRLSCSHAENLRAYCQSRLGGCQHCLAVLAELVWRPYVVRGWKRTICRRSRVGTGIKRLEGVEL